MYAKKQAAKKKRAKKVVMGTKEWSVKTVNCVNGCSHDCRYCYARYDAVDRFHRMPRNKWKNMLIRPQDVRKKHKDYGGRVMFPSTHDITPEVLEPCLTVIDNLVKAGNDILIVIKPHYESVTALCRMLADDKPKILFRFTIGGMDDAVLSYWEPGAPTFSERFKCLKYAFKHGFNTSVSVEPMLEPWNVHKLVRKVTPYVSDSIWLGMLNSMSCRAKPKTQEDRRMVARLTEGQSDENIHAIYESLRNHPKVKWKESIKKVVGLEVATEAGLDE